jgi:hypothetical protein
MCIFQRLVVTLGDREDGHLGLFAKVEHRRTHEIADILYNDNRACPRLQQREPACHHVGFEVAAGAGIDLNTFTICALAVAEI